MAAKHKHRRFFRDETEKTIDPEFEEINKVNQKKIFGFLDEAYGILEKDIEDLVFLKKGKDVWVTNKSAKNFISFEKQLTINSLGMRAIRNAFDKPKITTNFAIFLNDRIKKNIYDLSDEELELFTHGYDLELNDKNLKQYIVMRYNKQIFGVAVISDNKIKNQVPKGRKLKNQI